MEILERRPSSGILERLRTPAILDAALTIPFLILEVANGGVRNGFPAALFVGMWPLSLSFFLALIPAARAMRAGEERSQTPFALLARIGAALLVAGAWIGLALDQMHCFLGVPNCDQSRHHAKKRRSRRVPVPPLLRVHPAFQPIRDPAATA